MITTHRTIKSLKDRFKRSGLEAVCSSDLKSLGSPRGQKLITAMAAASKLLVAC